MERYLDEVAQGRQRLKRHWKETSSDNEEPAAAPSKHAPQSLVSGSTVFGTTITKSSDGGSEDYRPKLIQEFERLRTREQLKKNTLKALSYSRAIESLKGRKQPIRCSSDVDDVPFIGKRLRKRVLKIIDKGHLSEAMVLQSRERTKMAQDLKTEQGAGPSKEKAFIGHDITSAAYPGKNRELLSHIKKSGKIYHDQSSQNIPRNEMHMHWETLASALVPHSLRGEVAGPYRRGASESSDINLLITYKPEIELSEAKYNYESAIRHLVCTGYIVDVLSSADNKWAGHCKLSSEGIVRRLVMLLLLPREFPFALLYCTGPIEFYNALQRHSLGRGYWLNDRGLVPVSAASPQPPKLDSEKCIFEFLGLVYLPPGARTVEALGENQSVSV